MRCQNTRDDRIESKALVQIRSNAESSLKQGRLHVLGLEVERAGMPRNVAALDGSLHTGNLTA